MNGAKAAKRGIALVLTTAMAAGLMVVAGATPASAGHNLGVHWAGSSYPINLRPVNSFSPGFREAGVSGLVVTQWNRSVKFNNVQRFWRNGADLRRRCPWVAGSVRMCDYNWGRTGWAGVARIRSSGSHIRQVKVQINNFYGTSRSYRTHVLCHEFGHALGLAHQANGNHSCMDDSSAGWDELSPNRHDYRMLRRIYDHRHRSASASGDGDLSHRGADSADPNRTVTELPNGDMLITYILPAPTG